MFNLMSTLIRGTNARATEAARDHFSLELIDQKIRETEAALRAAKATLASLIQRQRSEERQMEGLNARIDDMIKRCKLAMDDGNEALAQDAAQAIAEMENERDVRRETLTRLRSKVDRMRLSLEKAQRRLVDLKQGAISARAVEHERRAQSTLSHVVHRSSSATEAEELIARVLGKDDPYEKDEILAEIEDELSNNNVTTRLGEAGYGSKAKLSGSDVLARLKTSK